MVSSGVGHEEISVTSEDSRRLKQTSEFKHLGSITEEKGGTEMAMRQRVRDVRQKWRDVIRVTLDKKNTIETENENIQKCAKTSTFVWCRNLVPKVKKKRAFWREQ